MRDTGGPDTTVGNSMINALIWFWCADVVLGYAFARHVSNVRHIPLEQMSNQIPGLTRYMEYLGFKIKLKAVDTIPELEFLKGTFYLTSTGTYTWAPLPSRFLKIGKCIQDPRQVYRTRDLSAAITIHASSLAASYHAYSQVPLLRAFVDRFYKPGQATAHLQMERMIVPTGVPLADPLIQIAQRYEVDVVDILQVEEWIRSAPLFTFFEHPLFGALARDYT